MGSGVRGLTTKQNIIKNLSRLAILSLILFTVIKLLFIINFEVDERWYARFPRAIKGTNTSYIGDDLRMKKETPEEIMAQKKNLTRANFLPLLHKDKLAIADKILTIRNEIKQKNITVLDIWKYIYEK
jgi:hypothetical protein